MPKLDEIFIALAPGLLVTSRQCEPRSILMFAERLQNDPALLATAEDGLLALLDAISDRIADILEALGGRSDSLSQKIFCPPQPNATRARLTEENLQDILQGIGQTGDMIHMARDSLRGMTRLLSFLKSGPAHRLTAAQLALFQTVEQDVRALGEDAQFAAQESAFLLDATLGQINIEQNNIIKIFTIVGVVFAPPTLLASIWGMNFHNIPELEWHYGYYIGLACLLISAALPLAYFKRKGWV